MDQIFRPTQAACERRVAEGSPLTLRFVRVGAGGRVTATFDDGSPTPFITLDEMLRSTRLRHADFEEVTLEQWAHMRHES